MDENTAYDAGAAGDADAVLAFLKGSEPGEHEAAARGLVDGAPATVKPLVDHVRADPLDAEANHAILALGDILGEGRASADDIVPVLGAALERQLAHGFKAAEYTVAALAQAASVTTLHGLGDAAEQALADALRVPGLSWWAVENVLTVLRATGDDATDRIERVLAGVPEDNPLAAAVRKQL